MSHSLAHIDSQISQLALSADLLSLAAMVDCRGWVDQNKDQGALEKEKSLSSLKGL